MPPRRSSSASLPQSTTRYQIESWVGGGGMGEIFRAIDLTTHEPVAIKLLRSGVSPHEQARFRREVAVLADLRHPNVVRYIDHGVWPGGRSFLAMEWLDGEDLEARRRRDPPGMQDSVEAIRRASAALAAVHARGVVHRDIKLANLWLCGGRIQRVKLIDFGVVKLPEDDGFSTQPGAIVGTPFHMAPEQARNEPITPRSDVYSLGSVLFLLLTGRLVFPSEHLVALLSHLVIEDAPRVSSLRPDVPDTLDELVARCLDRDPARRFEDGGDLARALSRVGPLNSEPPIRSSSSRSSSSLRSARSTPRSEPPQRISELPPVSRSLLGASGKRLVAVVLASLEQGLLPKELSRILRAMMTNGDHFEPIRGERLVLVLGLSTSQGDEALRAARAALSIYRFAPGARIALASGLVHEAEAGLSAGTLERAAWLLEHTSPGEVRVDRETVPLLGTRFRLQEDSRGTILQEEEEGLGRTRQLLGRPTPTTGRDREFSLLGNAFLRTLADRRPRAVLVSGSAGIGKSRLRYELMRWLRVHPEVPEVLLCRGAPLSDQGGSSTIGRALRAKAGILDGEDPAKQLAKLRVFLGLIHAQDPQDEPFFGELLGVRMSEALAGLQAARQEPALMLQRLRGVFEMLLRAGDLQAPQVLIVEDCHWIDELTRSLIHWALASPRLRFIVFGFARSGAEVASLGWPLAQHIELGPLTREDALRLVHEVLPNLSDEMSNAIVDRAGGNALFLEELIRYAAEGHEGLPLTVQALVQTRLDAMRPELRGVARAASVFGRTCWSEGIASLLGAPCEQELVELEQSEILWESEESRLADQRAWTFRHALVREAIYASLLEEDRSRFHKSASYWLESAGEEDLATIAWHAEQGGDRARAGGLFARAATQAQAAGYLDRVIALADRGIACAEDSSLQGTFLIVKARASYWIGLYNEALVLAEQGLPLCQVGDAMWAMAVRVQSSTLRDLGRQHDSEQVLREALRVDRLSADVLGLLLAEQARTLADLGKFHEARASVEHACQIAEQTQVGYEAAKLQSADARFFVVASQGLLAEQIVACLDVVQLADTLGDVLLGTRARCNLGHSFNSIGRFEEAQEVLSQAASDAVRSRTLPLQGFALHNLGLTLARLGYFEEALLHQQNARMLAEQMGHERLRVSSLQYEALALAWQGKSLDSAQRIAREALALAANQPSQRLLALRVLAFIQYRRGSYEATMELLGEPGVVPIGGGEQDWGMLVQLALIETLMIRGERQRVRELLQQAFRSLQSSAYSLPESDRHGFLYRLDENRRILELARQHNLS